MDIISRIWTFLTSKETSIGDKAAITVVLFMGLWLIDDQLGFSYFYKTDRKISAITKLNEIIYRPEIDDSTKLFAIGLRREILNKKTLVQRLLFPRSAERAAKTIVSPNAKINPSNKFRWSIYAFSACGLFLMIGLVKSFYQLINTKGTIIEKAGNAFAYLLAYVAFSGLLLYLLGLVPKLHPNTWNYNYILNMLVSTTILIVGIKIFSLEDEIRSKNQG